ncbi:MAG: metal ABC transporter substrate-binding protein [Clostridia bacterium]|nr:metal ABC transporter substrate-binding protein [Clostridia bacterium]
MKKIIAITLCLMMLASVMTGCATSNTSNGDKLSIVTTIFPEYDWVVQILGGNAGQADVTMLLDNGVDLHSYQPTADDIIRISTCDMFIHVGGESDEWVNDVLKEATNKDTVVINLLEALGDDVKEEEVREGMQEDEHEHGDGHEEEDHGHEEEEEEAEYDEHVWLSLKNSAKLCGYIAGKLGEIDPDHKDTYTANANAYIEKLNALDGRYREAVSAGNTKTLLFGDRFPFRYLTDDYGLDYYAAFAGCSSESEASFETVMFLANKTDELGLKAIMQIESANGKIARTIKDTTKNKDQTILTLDSMQSTTMKDVKNGVSYLSVMEKNLAVLKDALK